MLSCAAAARSPVPCFPSARSSSFDHQFFALIMNPALMSRPCIMVNSLLSRKMAGTSAQSGSLGRERRPTTKAPPAPIALTALPVKPTRPATAYTLYALMRHEQLKQKDPSTKWKDTQKTVSNEWKTVDDSVRQRLEQQRKGAADEYKDQMKEYKAQLKQTVVLADVMRYLTTVAIQMTCSSARLSPVCRLMQTARMATTMITARLVHHSRRLTGH